MVEAGGTALGLQLLMVDVTGDRKNRSMGIRTLTLQWVSTFRDAAAPLSAAGKRLACSERSVVVKSHAKTWALFPQPRSIFVQW